MNDSNFRPAARHRIFASRTLIGVVGVGIGTAFARPVPLAQSRYLPVRILSLAVIGLGFALRSWAAAFAGSHTRTDFIEAPKLATGGPYAHVRNPIYLGSLFLGAGMVSLIGDRRLFPLYVLTMTLLLGSIIPAEEAFLEQRFGADYTRFTRAVPRLIPTVKPWSGEERRKPDWTSARGEFRVAGLLLGILVAIFGVAFLKKRRN